MPAVDISALRPEDKNQWLVLASRYMAFYDTIRSEAEYEALWLRLLSQGSVLGLGARRDGQLVGFVHYTFHASSWSRDVCYLQDLFVAQPARCSGIGRALINRVAEEASKRSCPRLHWLTHKDNETARRVYDGLAVHSGFIRYEMALPR